MQTWPIFIYVTLRENAHFPIGAESTPVLSKPRLGEVMLSSAIVAREAGRSSSIQRRLQYKRAQQAGLRMMRLGQIGTSLHVFLQWTSLKAMLRAFSTDVRYHHLAIWPSRCHLSDAKSNWRLLSGIPCREWVVLLCACCLTFSCSPDKAEMWCRRRCLGNESGPDHLPQQDTSP